MHESERGRKRFIITGLEAEFVGTAVSAAPSDARIHRQKWFKVASWMFGHFESPSI